MSERRQGGGANAESPVNARGPSIPGPRQHPQAPDPLLGRIINNRYRIDSVIARGGMGKVYRAEQAPLGRVCALKILSPRYDGEDDPEFRRRFFLEASTAAKLTHANTVTIFDYGRADNEEIYYIAMEYIEGNTLSKVLQNEGRLPEERVRHITAQICRSLREAHGLGVVHRDLKPGNIMLSDKGDERDNVKVLDFGLVKDVTNNAQDHTQEGVFMGSPKYMSPEQILGLTLTPRADIYSLGIMLFEMLTGRVPYDRGAANIQTLMAHVNEPLPMLRTAFPELVISPQMEAIVYRCLEKDPARRYASMSALLIAIKGINDDGSYDTSGAYPRLHAASGPGAIPMMSPMAIPTPAPSDKTVLVRRPGEGREGKRRALLVGVGAFAALVVLGSGAFLATRHLGKSPASAAVAEAPREEPKPASAPATASAPAMVVKERTVHVESDPPGAMVSEESQELCASTPCDVILAGDNATKEHAFTVTKQGFKPSKPLSVDLQVASVSVKLVPLAGGAGAGAGRRKADSPKGDTASPSSKSDPYKPDPYQ